MSDQWHVIKPVEATNLLENPQFWNNITDGWTSQDLGAGAVFARTKYLSYYGIASAKITAGNATAQLKSNTFALADDATLYAQCRSYSTVATKNLLVIYDTTTPGSQATGTGTVTGSWEELTCNWKNETGGAVTVRVDLRNTAADSAAITYFDAVQAEIGSAETTYIDGGQPGCEWNGEEYNSTSTRSALSQDGGIEYDFGTGLAFWVDTEIGLSAAPVSNTFLPYAMTDGDLYNGSKRQGRPFTLGGMVVGSSKTDLHDKMHDILDIFEVASENEVRLSYDGGTSEKWFIARYEAGLQGRYSATRPVTQRLTLRMYSADPNLYQVNDTCDVLDVNDTATLRYIARRRRSTGQWDDMGLTANPTGGGTVWTILHASDGLVYVGGNFTGWDGNAGWDYGVIYNPQTDTFARWGGASDINGIVSDIVEGPDGTIYASGNFTNVGDANGDGIVSWTGAAWVSLGAPGATAIPVQQMAFDSSGNLHIVGGFENFAAVAAADGYAYWDGSAWATNGAPAVTGADLLYTIAIDVDDNIYVGGLKDNIGGVTYDNIAMWDSSAWVDVGIGLSVTVSDMAVGIDGKTIYIVGSFTNAGGVTNADYITIWTGTQYLALGTPPNAACYFVNIAPNGNVWITGNFTTIGGYTISDRIAFWNGATWTIPDINLPGSPIVYTIEFTNIDPKHNNNFDTYIGFSSTGSASFAGDTTVNNPGNKDAYPTFVLSRSGGTSAKLYSIRNETTSKQIYFQHGFTDGDTLTIELSANGGVVTSDFMGNRRYALLPNSDQAEFVLIPGDNNITCFVYGVGGPTITANCLHKAVFTGYDD